MFKYFVTAVFVAVLLVFPVVADAGFVYWGNGYWVFDSGDGTHDGWMYRTQACADGSARYVKFRRLTYAAKGLDVPVVGVHVRSSGTSLYSPQAVDYGQIRDDWRSELLKLASSREEHRQYLEAIKNLGISGLYGIQTPAGLQYGSGLYGAINYSPLQQGNTVYGQYTYNSVADPFRSLDLGALLNRYTLLAEQVQKGSSEAKRDLAELIESVAEGYRLHADGRRRAQIATQAIEKLDKLLTPSKAQKPLVAQTQDKAQDKPAPPFAGDMASKAAQLVRVMTNSCLRCHGGAQTGRGQNLKMGAGQALNLDLISRDHKLRIWEKVRDGEMPPGGGLSEDQKSLFKAFFSGG